MQTPSAHPAHTWVILLLCVSVCNRKSSCPFSLIWGPGFDQVRKSFWRTHLREGRWRRGPTRGAWERTKSREGFQKGEPSLDLLLGEEDKLREVSSGRGECGRALPHSPCLQGLVKVLRSCRQASSSLTQSECFLAEKLR